MRCDYNPDTYDTIAFSPAEIRRIANSSKQEFSERTATSTATAYLIEAGRIFADLRRTSRGSGIFSRWEGRWRTRSGRCMILRGRTFCSCRC